MVVIPQRRGKLPVWIVSALPVAGSDPIIGVSIVVRGYVPTVKMNRGAYVGHTGSGAMQRVVDEQTVPLR